MTWVIYAVYLWYLFKCVIYMPIKRRDRTQKRFSEPGHQALRQQEFSVAAPSVDSRGGAASRNGNCEMWKKQEIRWPLIPGRQIDLSALVCLPGREIWLQRSRCEKFCPSAVSVTSIYCHVRAGPCPFWEGACSTIVVLRDAIKKCRKKWLNSFAQFTWFTWLACFILFARFIWL